MNSGQDTFQVNFFSCLIQTKQQGSFLHLRGNNRHNKYNYLNAMDFQVEGLFRVKKERFFQVDKKVLFRLTAQRSQQQNQKEYCQVSSDRWSVPAVPFLASFAADFWDVISQKNGCEGDCAIPCTWQQPGICLCPNSMDTRIFIFIAHQHRYLPSP